MKKRDQFFLVAALVIIAVVASLATVYNNVKVSQQEVSVYDLSKQIKYEGLQYLDSTSHYASNQGEVAIYLTDLVLSYSTSYPDTNIIIIYGNLTNIQAIEYNSTSNGMACIGTACQSNQIPQIIYPETQIQRVDYSTGSVTILLGDDPYSFDINEQGQNFFLVFLKKIKDDNVFVSNPAPPECGEESQPCCQEDLCNGNLICKSNGKCH